MSVRAYKNKKGEIVPGSWEINCYPQGRKGKQLRKVVANTTKAKAKRIELALRRQHSHETMPHDPKVIDTWGEWLKHYSRECAPSTLKDIEWASLKLLDHFGQWHLSRLTLPLFEQYLDKRKKMTWKPPGSKGIPKPVSKSRINTEMKYMGLFLRYCYAEKNYMLKPPFDIPKFKKLPHRIKNLPNIDEVDLLLEKCGDDPRLAALLYHDAGLRRNEGLNVKAEDVFLDDWKIRVIGKGDKERFAVIGTDRLHAALKERIEKVGSGLLMKNPTTAAPYKDLRKGIEAAAERAGISKNVYNHLFRGVHASRLHDAGVPLVDIQEQLGHADIGTTRKYITTTLGKRVDRVKGLNSYLAGEKTRLRKQEAKKATKPRK